METKSKEIERLERFIKETELAKYNSIFIHGHDLENNLKIYDLDTLKKAREIMEAEVDPTRQKVEGRIYSAEIKTSYLSLKFHCKPHLYIGSEKDFNNFAERVRINGKPASKVELISVHHGTRIELWEKYHQYLEESNSRKLLNRIYKYLIGVSNLFRPKN